LVCRTWIAAVAFLEKGNAWKETLWNLGIRTERKGVENRTGGFLQRARATGQAYFN